MTISPAFVVATTFAAVVMVAIAAALALVIRGVSLLELAGRRP